MGQSTDLDQKLRPVADAIIRSEADLTISDKNGYSACTRIFQIRHGLVYLEQFVYRYIDLLALHDMDTVDYWLITTLARAHPTFQRCLEAEHEAYRTPRAVSSSVHRPLARLADLDVDRQLESLQKADVKHRTAFLRSLCENGTLAMLQPFLDNGIDLDEVEVPTSKSYLRAAARQGNLEIVDALVQAGASVSGRPNYWQPYIIVNGVVDELVDRWHTLERRRPEYYGHAHSPESEFWILPKLLQNPTFHNPNALLLAIWWESDHRVYETLLDHACGRRDGQAAASWQLRTYGSEVIEAIKCDNPVVISMLKHGLALEVEDNWGCTALIHALDKGKRRLDYTQILIDAGADLERRTGCRYTPLEFAEINMHAKHPRMPQRTWNTKTVETCNSKLIELEEDRETYARLKRAISEKKGYQALLCTLSPQFIVSLINTNNSHRSTKDKIFVIEHQPSFPVFCLSF
jgi:hypothetical protein